MRVLAAPHPAALRRHRRTGPAHVCREPRPRDAPPGDRQAGRGPRDAARRDDGVRGRAGARTREAAPVPVREIEPEVATMHPSRATRGIVLLVGVLGTVAFGVLAALGVLMAWASARAVRHGRCRLRLAAGRHPRRGRRPARGQARRPATRSPGVPGCSQWRRHHASGCSGRRVPRRARGRHPDRGHGRPGPRVPVRRHRADERRAGRGRDGRCPGRAGRARAGRRARGRTARASTRTTSRSRGTPVRCRARPTR